MTYHVPPHKIFTRVRANEHARERDLYFFSWGGNKYDMPTCQERNMSFTITSAICCQKTLSLNCRACRPQLSNRRNKRDSSDSTVQISRCPQIASSKLNEAFVKLEVSFARAGCGCVLHVQVQLVRELLRCRSQDWLWQPIVCSRHYFPALLRRRGNL